jgi:hypothetical protein
VAKRTGETAAHRVRGARRWAAPRIEQAAHAVQDTVAPKVSAALEATAQRIEPPPAQAGKGRVRRALSIGGVAVLTALAGAIMALARRRRDTTTMQPNGTDEGPATAMEPPGHDGQAASDPEAVANGQQQSSRR